MIAAGLVIAAAAPVLSRWFGLDAALGYWALSLYAGFTLLHTLAGGAAVFAGVAVTGLIVEALIGLEVAHKAVLATILAIPLAFAQTPGPDQPRPEAAKAGEARTVRPEIQLGLYGGGNSVSPGDVFLKQPNGTDMILRKVPFRGDAFDDPPYYGVRATYWPARMSSLGVMVDYTHAKAISERNAAVEQQGMRDGKPVPPREPVSATFTKLEYSHGLNFLTINAVYRFRGLHARFVPYFGAGIGIMLPHTEIARAGRKRHEWTYRYELSGLGLQGLAGIEWRIRPSSRFQPFTEFKLGYARNHTDLVEGGWVKSNLFAQQAILGLSAYVRPPLPAGPAR